MKLRIHLHIFRFKPGYEDPIANIYGNDTLRGWVVYTKRWHISDALSIHDSTAPWGFTAALPMNE